jgi:hypothetical protein
MKIVQYFLLLLCIGITLFSCKKTETDDPPVTPNDTVFEILAGKVQKGPYITGTTIVLYELNDGLVQTGKSFTTTIQTDDGGFELNQIELNAGPALFIASGFYFHELFGVLSSAPLTLHALVDLKGISAVNINVVTHLIKERIMKLTASGLPFDQAKQQAQQEILAFFGITLPGDHTNFEQGDISQDSDLDAALLAISVVLQRYTNYVMEWPSLTAELTQLLANISYDFKEDGMITAEATIDTLLYNISMANLIDIRSNLEKRYADIGFPATVPDFESYVSVIHKHLSEFITPGYQYPDMASPDINFQPDTTSWVLNLLNMNSVDFYTLRDYSVAAIVPFDSTLKVTFVFHSGQYAITPLLHGWEITGQNATGFTIHSTLQNSLITMPVGFAQPGTATIEFYKNDAPVPYRVKNIAFQ